MTLTDLGILIQQGEGTTLEWGLLAAGVLPVGYLDAGCRVLPGIRAVICGSIALAS